MNYIGTKKVNGTPMSRLAYNQHKGWTLPADENGADEGYLVEYDNGHQSWSPKGVFESSYRSCDNLSFGLAIEALKQGNRITRPSWNGKGMWLVLVEPGHYDVGCKTLNYTPGQGEYPEFAPWIGMLTAQGKFTPWAPAQSDVLADDWQLLEEPVTGSNTSIVKLPLGNNNTKALFGLILGSGADLDTTDSIESIRVLRVLNHHGEPVEHTTVAVRRGEQRKLIAEGQLVFGGARFQVIVDTETANSRILTDLPRGIVSEFFIELEVTRTNHNRR